jgi:hypothetical protein
VIQAILALLLWLKKQAATFPERVREAVAIVVGWLLDFAIFLTSWLPRHTPIDWEALEGFAYVFRGLGVFGRFVPFPILFATLGFIVVYTGFVLLYAVYRGILGLIPAAK